ncbi:MAG: TIR domain-containing protein [Cyanobacteria bacterium P01_F01_bin.150]
MPEPVKVFLSYVERDRDLASKLYTDLKNAGFAPWMADNDLLPGSSWREGIDRAMHNCDAFLFCLPSQPYDVQLMQQIQVAFQFLSNRLPGTILIIPIFTEVDQNSQDIARNVDQIYAGSNRKIVRKEVKERFNHLLQFQAVRLFKDYKHGLQQLVKALKQLGNRLNTQPHKTSNDAIERKTRNFQLSKIELSNIRCFKELVIDLGESLPGQGYQSTQCTMILGDNAAGKTTLLRSIALGLCNQTDAAVLMRSPPGNFIRQGATKGTIKLTLQDVSASRIEEEPLHSDNLSEQQEELVIVNKYTITTIITKQTEDIELIHQTIAPAHESLEDDLFICGYGANRIAQSYTNYERYRIVDAVQSLFSKQPQFHNAEVVLLRRDPIVRKQLEERLLKLLMLDEADAQIHYTERGIELSGPWGRQSLQVLSDGYRNTSEWLLDFMSWAIQSHRLTPNTDIGGILLIDELEQHLHPRWQRFIVQRLQEMLPNTQIIASTHTPLVTSGLADVENGMVLKLDKNDEGQIEVRQIPSSSLAGKRADQILVSDAFGLFTSRNPGSQTEVDRYTELLSNPSRTPEEEEEFQALCSIVQDLFKAGEREIEQLAHRAVSEALDNAIEDVSPELLELEIKKQLQQLSQSEAD